MNLPFILLLLAALAIVLACAWHWNRSTDSQPAPTWWSYLNSILRRHQGRRVEFCNIAEGRNESGDKTYLADAVIATRYLLVKIGSDASHIAVCSAITDKPLGPCTDEPSAAEEACNVALLGAKRGTLLGVSGAAIAAGAYVATTAAGKLQTAVSTQYIVGRALNASGGADELIEYVPMPATVALP